MRSVQVLQLYSVGETGWSARTPFYPEPKLKDFPRHTKAERINHQQIFSSKNIKGSPSDRRKLIPDGSMNVHKGMERIKNGKSVGKHQRLFSYF